MRVREYQQETADDMGTAGTLTYPLDFTDPITQILMRFNYTNGASGNRNNAVESNISKIEIVDGGEVLWSCPGDVALAAAAHFANKLPNCYRTGAQSDSGYQVIPISFGRFPFDPLYAFNPSAHRNPQLKITFDEATIRAAGATGYDSDSFTLDLVIRLMEESPAPNGFLSLREVETYTSLGGGVVISRLPADRVIRALLVREYASGADWRAALTNFKLSADGGKFVSFDLGVQMMTDIMCEVFKPLDIPHYGLTDNAEAHQTWVGIDLIAQLHAVVNGYIIGADTPWKSQLVVYMTSHAGVSTDGLVFYMSTRGWGLHNTLIYPFGRVDVPEEWFNPAGLNTLDLGITQAVAAGEVNVCLQQVYPY